MKKKSIKIVGILDKDIIKKWILEEPNDLKIYQSVGLYKHIFKHIKEYTSIDSANYTIDHIEDVIANPDYVCYNPKQKSIEYYKKLLEPVSIVVQRDENDLLYVASVYPVTETKIKNRILKEDKIIEKQLIEKYTYKETV